MANGAPHGHKVPLKFRFNDEKALAVLAFVAAEHPGFTPLYVCKVLFFAEKWHLNRFGRPIIADTFIAMPKGPVPSAVRNFIEENWNWVEKPENFERAVRLDKSAWATRLFPGQEPADLSLLSETDVEILREAIGFCKNKSAKELSKLTHFEKSWINADSNRSMDYEDFIDDDNPQRDAILEEAREFAVYGVL
jgi:uncharacterized phage-associated protein